MPNSNLFKPLKIGNITLQNRIVLAPLTRLRADKNGVPLPFVAEYYAQRACSPGTLLISEATFIANEASGYFNAPGIYSKEQIDAWKKVTSAVHEKKSFIYLQLWALGRVSQLSNLKTILGENAKVVGPSNIPLSTGDTPTPMIEEEIHKYIALYAQASKNAIEAGFDGVEIHAANGYLIDQFLQDVSNNRIDNWGGSIENRARFAIKVTEAISDAIGPERTAIRISPMSTFQEMRMKDFKPQFTYLVQELRKMGIAYLHAVSSRVMGIEDVEERETLDFLLDAWGNENPFIAAGGFHPETAREFVDSEHPQRKIAIAFGRHFISNPDLVFRIKAGIELTPYDRNLFYVPEQALGYTSYDFSKEFEHVSTTLNEIGHL